MLPDDPRHGTNGGYYAGCRDECCRSAATKYVKRLRMDQANGLERTVLAIGTWRRIEALMCLGWSQATIAERAGLCQPNISEMLRSRRDRIRRSIADRIAAVYDDLSMLSPMDTSPQSAGRVRAHARRRGYAPPLAWDDDTIDDPSAVPNHGTVKPSRGGRHRDDLMEDAEWLADDGLNLDVVLDRLDITRDAFHQACRRANRLDLYHRLMRRVVTSGGGEASITAHAVIKSRGAA